MFLLELNCNYFKYIYSYVKDIQSKLLQADTVCKEIRLMTTTGILVSEEFNLVWNRGKLRSAE